MRVRTGLVPRTYCEKVKIYEEGKAVKHQKIALQITPTFFWEDKEKCLRSLRPNILPREKLWEEKAENFVAMFCWLCEKFAPLNKAGRKRYSAIFSDPEFLFRQLGARGGKNLVHWPRGSYFSWWRALCHTRPAFMTTCRILAFTAGPLKRFTAAKTLLYDSAKFARPLFHISVMHDIKWYAE